MRESSRFVRSVSSLILFARTLIVALLLLLFGRQIQLRASDSFVEILFFLENKRKNIYF